MKYEIGLKIDKITITDYGTYRTGNGRRYYILSCNCGRTWNSTGSEIDRYLRYLIRDGYCGCKNCKLSKSNSIKENSSAKYSTIYYRYKKAAKNRGINFELSLDEAADIYKSKCVYCGQQSTTKKIVNKHLSYNYTGIDRIDSSKGYMKNNCVPCCQKCNVAKHVMNISEFYSHVATIYDWSVQRLERRLVDSSESKWEALLNKEIKRLEVEDIV